MPRRLERHASSKTDWGTGPSRSAQVAAAAAADPEPPKRAPGRKDTRRWCQGKVGVEHTPEVALKGGLRRTCGWRPRWRLDARRFRADWECWHEERCANCGKVSRYLGSLGAADCPDFPGDDQQRQAAVAEAIQWNERRAERPPRKPVITGPQGYRRQRPG